jgi:hypothetical protein
MSDLSELPCTACNAALERLRYYPRQLLTADDMRTEQEYFREKERRHKRMLHGWGVVCGCEVKPLPDLDAWRVRVCPGFAVGPQGDDILIDDCIDLDLMTGCGGDPCAVRWPCPPTGEMPGGRDGRLATVYVAVRYAECLTRPARVHPAGCGCDEPSCEYSRIRESFEVKLLWTLPESHTLAAAADLAWCAQLQQPPQVPGTTPGRLQRFPVPPCPPCPSDPWVVLASVSFPATQTPPATGGPPPIGVSYNDRRVLLSTRHLQQAMLCLP